MTKALDLRSLLAEGRYALSVGKVRETCGLIQANPRLAARLIE